MIYTLHIGNCAVNNDIKSNRIKSKSK